MLFFDIGGGSLEFVYSDGLKIRNILSLPLGGLRLTQLYADRDGFVSRKGILEDGEENNGSLADQR